MLADSCKINRARLIKELKANYHGKIYFQGGLQESRQGTDTEILFRQESNFLWLFGVEEPGYVGYLDLDNNKSTLLVPKLDQLHAIWVSGDKVETLEEKKKKYKVDQVMYLQNYNSYSTQTEIINIIKKLRLVKNQYEILLMKFASNISVQAHLHVMKATKVDMFEYQQANLFRFKCQTQHQAYLPICGSGRNNAILHYQKNSKRIHDGDLCLLDMGAEFCGYASDITVTFPANGTFTMHQAAIYQIVLEANRACIAKIKPGVKWGQLQQLTKTVIFIGLQSLGIITESADLDIVKVFMPHGLGHHLGIDVHDGRLNTDDILIKNMVITIEPGIYFIKSLIEQNKDKLDMDILNTYFHLGGVRIEDDILVTENSHLNLTKKIPRTLVDIETKKM